MSSGPDPRTAAGSPASGTPAALTTFVGRGREGSETRQLMAAARLVTLTGPGGVGKTRLAARVMADMVGDFADGAVFVELAPASVAASVPKLVADQLRLQVRAQEGAVDTVVDFLRERSVLIVLDNCEHLSEACAGFAMAVLAACPRVVVLATSRQSLAVAGEHVMPVSPLPVRDAVRLFTERAAAVWHRQPSDTGYGGQGDQEVLVRLCERLDGLPLAIELAAARVRVLSPEQILDRLSGHLGLLSSGARNAPARQRTLRATLDWSHELCTTAEQLAWARASVFAGSFDLEAAEYVCAGDGIAPDDVLELIDGLIDKSVLVREDADCGVRFRMLQLLREYGREHLEPDTEAEAVARRHRDWYAGLIRSADREWFSDRQPGWNRRLWRDHANVRAAVEWSLSTPGEAGVVLETVGRLIEYWMLRGLAGEARGWLERALATAPSDHPGRGFALYSCALHTLWLGDPSRAAVVLAQAESVAEDTHDDLVHAGVAHVRAFAAMLGVEPGTAALAAEAGDRMRRLGAVRNELHPLFIHGIAVAYTGDLNRARTVLERMHCLCVDAGDTFYKAMSLFGRAFVEVEFGDVDLAADLATQALKMDLCSGDHHGRAYRVETLAWVADRRRDHRRAARLFGVSAALWDRVGVPAGVATGLPHIGHVANTREVLGEQAFDREFAAGRAMPEDQAMDFVLCGDRGGNGADGRSGFGPLSEREAQVAHLVAAGLSNRDIAARLVISPRTAGAHIEHILAKLDLRNRTQIASWVSAMGAAAGSARES